MFLNDQETATDLLHYEAIAKTVVRLIRDTPKTPLTVGVHGDWGAGKSSVLKMTEDALSKQPKVQCLWFNGWAFEGFEDAKTVIIETIIEELQRQRPTSTKVKAAAKKLLKRVDWLKAARKAGGLAFNVATGLPTFNQIGDLIGAAKQYLGKQAEGLTREDLEGFVDETAGLLKPAEEESIPAHIHAFRKEFVELLEAAEIEQLVVIVDDLDRCLPETSIATLEAIRLFLFVERTAFVIGADEAMIEYAVREHFPDLPPNSGPVSYARNYLEKLIQVPFRIPALGPAETRTYITLLMVEAALGAQDDRFLNLLTAAREDMKRPWLSKGLDRAALVAAMGKDELPEGVDRALVLGSQLTDMLTDGTRGNPRQVKRFLNSMLLRHAIGEERGFSADIKVPILAKLILAERFQNDFFEYLVRLVVAAHEGKPQQIIDFENSVRSAAQPATPARAGTLLKKIAKADDASEIEGWANNEWVRNWIALDPPLSGEDLRPYIFVTRDKRIALSGASASGHLTALANQLMGSELEVRGAATEIRRLPSPAAEEVFDIVRLRILGADNFATKPKGISGLISLATEHPTLQRRLLGFAKEVDLKKAGTWLAAAFDASFTNVDVKKDYDDLLKSWASQTVNKKLQAATTAALTMKEGS
ncbi:MAG: NTPase KAP [Stenotrophomonas acidaminiphila]|uniref:Qat anti-phage system ATPase QatA n=1 Tax=Stenotrophomonas acidaminiphila TaxID=128780 RepID=UPI00096495DB|nr:Qat anti-phage system ATPase QatA [Stenotrophomonas acidaminiphila]MBN8801345.1 NTPase KAP [Stenotrophomonas acidaminiphila]MDF9443374.1 NTPase KAP [Stenotrophomonas acidaminiphila]OJY75660.1 MAG: NTPase KAP [Stenotrophomonas sp. 69-14]